jgi:hypothetical protein
MKKYKESIETLFDSYRIFSEKKGTYLYEMLENKN